MEKKFDMVSMEDYFSILTGAEKEVFTALAEHTLSLGYRAKRDKTSALGYSFTHSKVKRQILRFTSTREKPVLRIKFFATQTYSEFFHQAIRNTIEEYDYQYTGCYGCERCDGTHGYRYTYPDGREYFRCGSELIEIFDTAQLPLDELLDLLNAQHEFYLSDPKAV